MGLKIGSAFGVLANILKIVISIALGAALVIELLLIHPLQGLQDPERLGELTGGALFLVFLIWLCRKGLKKTRVQSLALPLSLLAVLFLNTLIRAKDLNNAIALGQMGRVLRSAKSPSDIRNAADQDPQGPGMPFLSRIGVILDELGARVTAVQNAVEPEGLWPDQPLAKLEPAALNKFALSIAKAEENAKAVPATIKQIFQEARARIETEAKPLAIGPEFYSGFIGGYDKRNAEVQQLFVNTFVALAAFYHSAGDLAHFLIGLSGSYHVEEDGAVIFNDAQTLAAYKNLSAAFTSASERYKSQYNILASSQRGNRPVE